MLFRSAAHSQEKDEKNKRHDGRKRQDALYRYISSVLEEDLLERLGMNQKNKKILGVPVSEVLSEEEILGRKLQLIIEQIRYANREVRMHAD